MTNEATWAAQLRLPVQAAPVDRRPGTASAIGGPGVTASLNWADLMNSIPREPPPIDPTVLAKFF